MNILISCVAEDSPRWAEMVRLLALSIRRFGDGLADSTFIANFVGSSESADAKALHNLGVVVRTVPPFDARCPWANKLRMLEMPQVGDHDLLLALDCDTVLMGDVRSILSTEALGAVPELTTAFSDGVWQRLFGEFGLNPTKQMVDPATTMKTWTYVNTGVLSIPAGLCEQVKLEWEESLDKLYEIIERRPRIAVQQNFADQISLAVAIAKAEVPMHFLPFSLNFHTGGVPFEVSHDLNPPFILHYHRHVDERGFLRRSGSPEPDRAIHSFNLARASTDGLTYKRPERRQLRVWMDKRSPLSRKLLRRVWKLKDVLTHRHNAV